MDKKLIESWETIVETSKVRAKLYHTVLDSVKNMQLVVLNLKIEAAHIELDSGKHNAIGVICDNLERSIKALDHDAKAISSAYLEYEQAKDYITELLKKEND
jgi:hypothetical protein